MKTKTKEIHAIMAKELSIADRVNLAMLEGKLLEIHKVLDDRTLSDHEIIELHLAIDDTYREIEALWAPYIRRYELRKNNQTIPIYVKDFDKLNFTNWEITHSFEWSEEFRRHWNTSDDYELFTHLQERIATINHWYILGQYPRRKHSWEFAFPAIKNEVLDEEL